MEAFDKNPFTVTPISVGTPSAVRGFLWMVLDVVDIFKVVGGERTGYLRAGTFFEELNTCKHLGEEYLLHKEGWSPIFKGLQRCLKPVNDTDIPLWKVIQETVCHRKPDLNSNIEGMLSVNTIFEELEKGGNFKEWVRHNIGWSVIFAMDKESRLVPFLPLDHSLKTQWYSKGRPDANPFLIDLSDNEGDVGIPGGNSSPSLTMQPSGAVNSSDIPISSIQYVRFHVLKTRASHPPQLHQLFFYFNGQKFRPKSVICNYPQKSPHNYMYAGNLIKDIEPNRKWYSGENANFVTQPLVDLQTVNIQVQFDFGAVYPIHSISYQLKTANDFPERDPISWEWYGSVDDSQWYLLQKYYSNEAPKERFATYNVISL